MKTVETSNFGVTVVGMKNRFKAAWYLVTSGYFNMGTATLTIKEDLQTAICDCSTTD
jgi:hypothetical protein